MEFSAAASVPANNATAALPDSHNGTTANSPASPTSPSSPLTDTQLLQLSLKNAVSAVAAGKATVAANNYALVVKIFFRKCFLLEELVLLALAMGYETRKAAQEGAASGSVEGQGSQVLPSVEVDENSLENDEMEGDGARDVDANNNNNKQRATRSGNEAAQATDSANAARTADAEQLVDPLANVGMLLPPGLDEDDYDEERNYYEQKRQREEERAHTHLAPPSQAKKPLAASAGSSASLAGLTGTTGEDIPGYDAATARWLACLLAKVHPDALPIATLEKLCKVPIPSRVSGFLATGALPPNGNSFSSPTSMLRPGSTVNAGAESGAGSSNTNTFAFPSSSAAAAAVTAGRGGGGGNCGAGGASGTLSSGSAGPYSPNINSSSNNTNNINSNNAHAFARLIPHLKSSPTASSLGGGSPTFSNATPTTTATNSNDLAAVFGTSSSSSLSLLFATLLWDVACALWNEGFVEDTHHWLSVMDVRRLWKLYGDSCANASAAAAGGGLMESPLNSGAGSPTSARGGLGNSNNNNNYIFMPSAGTGGVGASTPVSRLFASAEPPEESVTSEERACALSWVAVLAECSAADEPPPPSRSVSNSRSNQPPPRPNQQQQQEQQQEQQSVTPPSLPRQNAPPAESNLQEKTERSGDSQQQQRSAEAARLTRPRSGITLSAMGTAHGPLPMTSPTRHAPDNVAWPQQQQQQPQLNAHGAAGANVSSQQNFLTSCAAVVNAQEGAFRFDNLEAEDNNNRTTEMVGQEVSTSSPSNPAAAAVAEVEASSSTTTSPNTTVLHAIPMFVRRLARRTSALRDLCGLMMGCETAEDVFYVIYAFHCALEAQQRKMTQFQQQQQQQQQSVESTTNSMSRQPDNTSARQTTTSGGLAEVLIVANLLVEFFLAKRAQKILLDAGVLPAHFTSVTSNRDGNSNTSSTASPQQMHAHRGEQAHRMDRAIRQACDEVVCAFTNGQCLTLYGLESYGIPTPHDYANCDNNKNSSSGGGGGGSSSTGNVSLLAPELPYVLVSNVLSSTLNFATLYRLSKVFHGVMGVHGRPVSEHGHFSHQNSNGAGEHGGRRGGTAATGGEPNTLPTHSLHPHPSASTSAAPAGTTTTTGVLLHPNHTRKATEEERQRRRRWTRVAPVKPVTLNPHSTSHPHHQEQLHQQQQQQNAATSVVSELFGFMKGAAASWRNVANFVHPMSTEAEAQMETPTAGSTPFNSTPAATSARHDVRPSRIDPSGLSGDPALRGSGIGVGGGGYAERLAEARREHAAAAASRVYESTPWSAMSPNTMTSNNSCLANASTSDSTRTSRNAATSGNDRAKTAGGGGGGNSAATAAVRNFIPEVQTSGPGACELLLPSHPSTTYNNNNNNNNNSSSNSNFPPPSAASGSGAFSVSSTADSAAAGVGVSHFTISLLPEENERMRLGRATNTAAAAATGSGVTGAVKGGAGTPAPGPSTKTTTAASTEPVAEADTVLHTPSVQLQSRTPSEASCLRLLTLLYRYPQLHTLEPITASHVDLVAQELNKALHILQVAMKGRFGERWWRQWRARREGETQRYYARALADAQRGGHVLSSPAATAAPRANNSKTLNGTASGGQGRREEDGLNLNSSSPAVEGTGAVPGSNPATITVPAVVSPNSAGVPSPVDAIPPPTMVGSTTVQPDPSLVLRSPLNDDSMQQQPQQPPVSGFVVRDASPMSDPVTPPTKAGDATFSIAAPQEEDGPLPSPLQQGLCEVCASSYAAIPPPAAPQPSFQHEPVLSKFWNTRTLSIPTQEGMRERRQNLRGRSVDTSNTADNDLLFGSDGDGANARSGESQRHRSSENSTGSGASPEAKSGAAAHVIAASETAVVGADGTVIDVNWDVPPAYTPDVSLDFSAFTTTSVETQEATRQLVETLQRRQTAADDANANIAGVSLLSRACRRLLHNELPLLQQYSPWRVIYSTRMHGVSLSTLFANCKRESERHMRQANGLFSLPPAMEGPGGSSGARDDARPMLLVLELPASTTFEFAEDDRGVRDALAELRKPLTVEKASRRSNPLADDVNKNKNSSSNTVCTEDHDDEMPFNKLYIGAYLSDLLRLESRRYYGTQDCFVFQLLVPSAKAAAGEAGGRTVAPPPQLRTFHASRQNTQFINCRHTSIVIGGGGGGSSLYLDDSLCHGATSACATFNSPPLSVWQKAASTLCEVAGVQQPQEGLVGSAESDTRQHSLYVLNLEVIVMDA